MLERLLVAGLWLLVLGLALADAHVARRHPTTTAAGAPPRWSVAALVGCALVAALLRAWFAIERPVRNVDEYQYAATAAFAAHPGEGLLGIGWRLHMSLWQLGDPYSPVVPDLFTSLAVGATGWLLGWCLLRAAGLGPALLATLALPWGIVRFEGLCAQAEPWAALCVAGWLALRAAGPPDASIARRAAGGACLGLAVLMKEQALPFVLLEPAFLALELRAEPGPHAREWLRRVWPAVVGSAAPFLLLLVAMLASGALGEYVAAYTEWGRELGQAGAVGAEEQRGVIDVIEGVAAGLLQLVLPFTAVAALGLVQLVRRAGELGAPPSTPPLRLAQALALAGLLGLLCAALGLRFFGHYFQLALPPLAALLAWRTWDAAHEVRAARPIPVRAMAALHLALFALLLIGELSVLRGYPRFAEGNSLDREVLEPGVPSDAELAKRFAEEAARRAPADRPVLVWGWRPELYAFAGRAPSTRFQAGWLLRVPPARILEDLERWPPAAVLLPGPHGLLPGATEEVPDPYALERHPGVLEWLRSRGYREVGLERCGAYRLLLAP